MHQYRTHNCGELKTANINNKVKISGWINRKRDHGGLLFLDLRDHFGVTQCVISRDHKEFSKIESIKVESVISITGLVLERSKDTINKKLSTGLIEVNIQDFDVLSLSETIPFQISIEDDAPEDIRLKHRYLDLRKKKLHENIILRSKIIDSFRNKMIKSGFFEIQTPILSASSPEGARDFLVPSRIHHGKFYALPQAPQIFKQLLMVAGFDKYFQIAPCFRDEDARADRSPGEFYQLDFEMSFVNQEDIFKTIEPIIFEVFKEFSKNENITNVPFPIINYAKAIEDFGTDKPDLRNPLIIKDASACFINSGFKIFEENLKKDYVVKGIKVPFCANKPRAWFDKLNEWARLSGQKGLGYIIFENKEGKGPIAKNIKDKNFNMLKDLFNLQNGDCIFFISGKLEDTIQFSSIAREKLCDEVQLREQNIFKFCWIVDYPMFELNKETNKIDFSHNPFSMPQGGMNSLLNKKPLEILAWQFDIVCNGIELSSGAIRNHKPEVMLKAFEIAGYSEKDLKDRFSGLYDAFKFGAPPHGGSAPGIDRIVMLLANESNLREVVAFPLNQQAEDLMLGSPGFVDEKRLREVNILISKKEKEKENDKK